MQERFQVGKGAQAVCTVDQVCLAGLCAPCEREDVRVVDLIEHTHPCLFLSVAAQGCGSECM